MSLDEHINRLIESSKESLSKPQYGIFHKETNQRIVLRGNKEFSKGGAKIALYFRFFSYWANLNHEDQLAAKQEILSRFEIRELSLTD